MNLFFKIKRKIFKIFYQLFHRPYGEILGLHRVVEARSLLEDNRMLEITPAFLEQTILKYKAAGYRIVSLDEIQRQIEIQKREKCRFVCFTFDDGYADNYELAYPVFKKYNCPFTIYVTTDFPDQKALLWHYHLQDILLENEKLQFNGIEYDCSDLKMKNHTFRKIRELLFTSNAEMTLDALEQLFKDHADVVKHDVKALTWEQISDLATDPLCTIGAHTVSHPALTTLSDEEIRNEMSEGKKKIEEKIKKPVKHFAYPFGNWDNRVARLAMEQYSTSVLASGGLVRKGDALDRLKRSDLDEK
jgi:peptidoglycan/xylan/chitin deacetylase (PgdA/CDA1 family)